MRPLKSLAVAVAAAPLAVAAVAAVATAQASGIKVEFLEGAPKDRFVITNASACDLGAARVFIDLGGSDYGLIFDVTGQGAGVEVFQPLEFTKGADLLVTRPSVRDGDNSVALNLRSLKSKASVSFTIDVDDTANNREITVSDSEFSGSMVSLETGSFSARAEFTSGSSTTINLPNCT